MALKNRVELKSQAIVIKEETVNSWLIFIMIIDVKKGLIIQRENNLGGLRVYSKS